MKALPGPGKVPDTAVTVPTAQFLHLEIRHPVTRLLKIATIDPIASALEALGYPTLEKIFREAEVYVGQSIKEENGKSFVAYHLKIPPGANFRIPIPKIGGEICFGANRSGAPIVTVPWGYREEVKATARDMIKEELAVHSDAGKSCAFYLRPKRGDHVGYTLLEQHFRITILGWTSS